MNGRIEIGRTTKKQQRVIRSIVLCGLDRFYYNDCEDIQALAMEFGFTNTFTFLSDDDEFDPTNTDGGIALPNNQGYHYNSIGFEIESNRARVVSYEIESKIGHFFNGNLSCS